METGGYRPAKLRSLLLTEKDSSRGAFLKQEWDEHYGKLDGGGKKENRDEERFIHQTSRGVCWGSESRLTSCYLSCHAGISARHQASSRYSTAAILCLPNRTSVTIKTFALSLRH